MRKRESAKMRTYNMQIRRVGLWLGSGYGQSQRSVRISVMVRTNQTIGLYHSLLSDTWTWNVVERTAYI